MTTRFASQKYATDRRVSIVQSVSSISDLVAWWSPRVGVTLDGSSNVSAVTDLSGNGNDASQATEAARPPLVTFNGQSWFDFSQGNHYLTTSGPGATTNDARSIFAVVYLPYGSHTSTRRIFIESYSQYYGGSMEVDGNNRFRGNTNDGSQEEVVEGTTFPLQSVQTVGMLFEGGGLGGRHTLWRDGTQVVAIGGIEGSLRTSSQTGFRLGTYRDANDRWFDGYLGDVLIYDRYLTFDETAAVFDFLSRVYQ